MSRFILWSALTLLVIPVTTCSQELKTLPAGQWMDRAYLDCPFPDAEGWSEQVGERTSYQSTWIHSDGRVRVFSSSTPVHYEVFPGHLERIDPRPESDSDGWIARHQPYPVALQKSGAVALNAGHSESVRMELIRTPWGDQSEWSELVQTSALRLSQGLHPSVEREFYFTENGMKWNFRLSELPAAAGSDWTLTTELYLPESSTIAVTGNGSERDGWWYGDLMVTLPGGAVLSWIRGTMSFDAVQKTSLAGYRWYPSGRAGEWILETKLDTEWFLSSERNYPVTIDPLVTGPLGQFEMDLMPSCFIPEYNVDSLLVTVPGEITVTALMVTASFYADPFAFSVMADGSMYFSTACDETGTFEVEGPNGQQAGTAYLEAFDMRNPLMCCYNPSCSETSFYLRMHLGRYTPEGDCNTTYIYYTPGTLWPFTAYIEGHTVETAGLMWTVPGLPKCSNDCAFDGTVRIRYGVRPYTITHPWMTGSVVIGEPEPCELGYMAEQIPLTWPDCPVYCPTFDEVDVPPPTVVDACGNVVTDMPSDNLNIKPAPIVYTPPLPLLVCSGGNGVVELSSCNEEVVINWNGNGSSGSGDLIVNAQNTTGDVQQFNYSATAELDGCYSPVTEIPVSVFPAVEAAFTTSPSPAVFGFETTLVDQSDPGAGEIINWIWTVGEQDSYSGESPDVLFDAVGEHEVCLYVETENNCEDSLCQMVIVLPAQIVAPNVFTPNDDSVNEFLHFQYLELFPSNHLTVWNRWGSVVFEKENYRNDWDGDDSPDGVYYFLLKAGESAVEGYVHILR